jgi:hypothetical protein
VPDLLDDTTPLADEPDVGQDGRLKKMSGSEPPAESSHTLERAGSGWERNPRMVDC